MKQTIPLGRVAGVRIGAHWSALIMVALFGWLLGAEVIPSAVPDESAGIAWAVAILGALAFVVALLVHELAHSLVARHYAIPVKSITLWALGGVSELGGEPPTARSDFWVAVAGPAASAGAGAIFGGLAVAVQESGGPQVAGVTLAWLSAMNLLLAVFNLLPGAPLDGGRILRAVLWRHYGDRGRAVQSASGAGRVVGALLVGAGVAEVLFWRGVGGLWLMLIGVFVMTAASAEATTATAAAALAGVRVGDVMTPDPAIGATWMSVSAFVEQVALRSDQSEFPVVGPDMLLAGVVGISGLTRIPRNRWPVTTLGQVLTTVPPDNLAATGDPAAALLHRRPLVGNLVAVVLDDGRIVGLVTLTRLSQIVRQETLRTLSPR
jgi:Zn-dependent protease